MTISALEGFDAGDVLARNLGLYRDLAVALSERVTDLKATAGEVRNDDASKAAVEAAKASQRQLQTVLELEASLVKRRTDGGGPELDLDAARAEILARLAVWADGR